MKILDSPHAIGLAQRDFEALVKSLARESIPVTIGFPSGDARRVVLWLPELGIWAHFGEPPKEKSPGSRYWTVFGVGKPHGLVPIACEINSPKAGIRRQTAGAFAATSEGKVYVVHRGIFTAKGRVDYEYTRSHFHWKWQPVTDGGRTTSVMVVAEVASSALGSSLRDFIVEVLLLKEGARDRPTKGNT